MHKLSRLVILLIAGLLLMPMVQGVAAQSHQVQPVNFDPSQVALTLETVYEGFEAPVQVTNAGDGSGRLFIAERDGKIWIAQDGKLLPEPFLDISEIVRSKDMEQAFGSIAFHPDYEENGYFYAVYTKEPEGANVIARFQVSAGDPNRADPDSLTELLVLEDRFPNHNGGDIAFGPDGYLYVATGDEGGEGDPKENAQDGQRLFGKMLRIDVDHGDPYAIPPDNPFVDDPNVRDEIWAMGLRNPFRYSFDPKTGDLYIGDVGESAWEEVNVVPAGTPGGMNFGWPVMEGMHCFPEGAECNPEGYWLPVLEYSHAGEAGKREGCSIVGGRVYRGQESPFMDGVYVFGDWCAGRIWAAWRNAAGEWQRHELLDTFIMITSFGADEQGELYLTNMIDGTVARLRFSSAAPAEDPPESAFGDPAFEQLWARTDRPVLEGEAQRTWLWGPAPLAPATEDGEQLVQYFDKGRMELVRQENGPAEVAGSPLVTDLLSASVEINVAGDPGGSDGITYQTLAGLRDEEPFAEGTVLTTAVERDGTLAEMPNLATHNVTAGPLVEGSGHRVASVFQEFLRSEGVVVDGGEPGPGALFKNPMEAAGQPLTEACWTKARVDGTEKMVLVQPFENLVLTYTPDNPEGWRVELGNVGRHYFEWQSGQ